MAPLPATWSGSGSNNNVPRGFNLMYNRVGISKRLTELLPQQLLE